MRTAVRLVCLAAIVAALALACGDARRLNLVVITLDTTRADHLGAYGYPRPTSPALDAFAEEAVVFDRAYSQSMHTSPSHLSMLTGLRPHSHGVIANGERIATDVPTLAEQLAAMGYRTGGFVSGWVLSRELSDVDRGFEVFDADFEHMRRGGWQTTDAALAWLRSLRPDEPYFLWVHLYDAHGPYRVGADDLAAFRRDVEPRPVRVPSYQRLADGNGGHHDDVEYYIDAYDAALSVQDRILARTLRHIDRDRSIVVILADHGETLDERTSALNHGAQLFEEQTRIPLLIRVPGLAPRRIDGFVETTDLVPTLGELMQLDVPAGLEGRSLVSMMHGAPEVVRRAAVSVAVPSTNDEAAIQGRPLDERFPLVSLVEASSGGESDAESVAPIWKLIRYPTVGDPLFELYRVDDDPGERRDLAPSEPQRVAAMTQRLDVEIPQLTSTVRDELDEEQESQLRAIGYFE